MSILFFIYVKWASWPRILTTTANSALVSYAFLHSPTKAPAANFEQLMHLILFISRFSLFLHNVFICQCLTFFVYMCAYVFFFKSHFYFPNNYSRFPCFLIGLQCAFSIKLSTFAPPMLRPCAAFCWLCCGCCCKRN